MTPQELLNEGEALARPCVFLYLPEAGSDDLGFSSPAWGTTLAWGSRVPSV